MRCSPAQNGRRSRSGCSGRLRPGASLSPASPSSETGAAPRRPNGATKGADRDKNLTFRARRDRRQQTRGNSARTPRAIASTMNTLDDLNAEGSDSARRTPPSATGDRPSPRTPRATAEPAPRPARTAPQDESHAPAPPSFAPLGAILRHPGWHRRPVPVRSVCRVAERPGGRVGVVSARGRRPRAGRSVTSAGARRDPRDGAPVRPARARRRRRRCWPVPPRGSRGRGGVAGCAPGRRGRLRRVRP